MLLHRVLFVPKMRFSASDVTQREFVIAPPAGIRFLAPIERAAGMLEGVAAQLTAPAAPPARETP